MEPIQKRVTLSLSTRHAYALVTDRLTSWWPRDFTWSRERLQAIVVEPFAGGRCYERDHDGFCCDFGRVLVADPHQRVVFRWQIGPARAPEPDPAKASEVEIALVARGPSSTDVTVEHRGFERHGEGAEAYRAGMAQGWDVLVAALARAPAPSGPPPAASLRVCVDVPTLDEGVAFYRDALGLWVTTRASGFASLAGASLPLDLLEKAEGSAPSAATSERRRYARHWSPVHLDVVVSDLEDAVARATALGATLEGAIGDMGAGRIAYLADPFGHGLCLVELYGRAYLDEP